MSIVCITASTCHAQVLTGVLGLMLAGIRGRPSQHQADGGSVGRRARCPSAPRQGRGHVVQNVVVKVAVTPLLIGGASLAGRR